ncbi:MAG: hypothetical protein FD167_706 [bacterium]|nr:MAG: hypothetical protein FD167_706 [bacterium]
MTRYLVFFFTLIMLFSLGCATKSTNNNPTPNNDTPKQASTSPIKLEIAPSEISKEHIPKPALDGKTALEVFKHLKAKGWQLNEATAVDIPPFGSEEAVGFNRPDKVGFLVMRYDSLDIAQSKFGQIDGIYRNKFGRAITAKNLIVAVLGGQIRINSPDFKQLSEEEYIKLQEHLVEFCNL